MKRLLILASVALLMLALLAIPMTTQADDGSCQSGHVGTTFNFTFSGFSPNKYVTAYLVEPGGTAVNYDLVEPGGTAVNSGSFKTSNTGSVSISINSHFGDATLGLGNWKIVVEEHANGNVLVHKTIGCFTVTGGTEGVSGATLSTSETLVHPNEKLIISGTGFMPLETVSLWSGRPNSCSSFSAHYVDAKNGATYENIPVFGAWSSVAEFDIKVDAHGEFHSAVSFAPGSCAGIWNVVARGNTSKRGGSVEVALVGNRVGNTASLVASKEFVNPFNDTIFFDASDFGAKDTLSCWTTSPDGRAIEYGLPGSFQVGFKADASGSVRISLTTGSHLLSPDDPFAMFGTYDPQMSEGALGVWSMSCQGLPSGKIGIAHYCLGPCIPPPVGKDNGEAASSTGGGAGSRDIPCQGLICGDAREIAIPSP